jgi:hypothetical protein
LGEGIPESVLVLSVATGIAAMAAMFEAEITQACGPKSKHNLWWCAPPLTTTPQGGDFQLATSGDFKLAVDTHG